MRVMLAGYQCCRCGYLWRGRRPGPPKRCARCGAPGWNTPRTHPQFRPKKYGPVPALDHVT